MIKTEDRIKLLTPVRANGEAVRRGIQALEMNSRVSPLSWTGRSSTWGDTAVTRFTGFPQNTPPPQVSAPPLSALGQLLNPLGQFTPTPDP